MFLAGVLIVVTRTGGTVGNSIGAPQALHRLVPAGLFAPQYIQVSEALGMSILFPSIIG
jgi:hypothetical protein